VGNFNLIERNDHERRLSKLHESIRSGLNQDVGTVGNTGESNLPEGDIDIDAFVLSGVGNLFSKRLELTVERGSASSLFLLSLKLFFITIPVLASAVASFIKLHLGGLAVELDIPSLSLSNHDGVLEMYMNKNNQLMCAGLEEEMLDVAEEYVDVLTSERRQVAETVLVNFDFSRNTLSIQGGPQVNVRQLHRASIYKFVLASKPKTRLFALEGTVTYF
jgi:hypothetical protein